MSHDPVNRSTPSGPSDPSDDRDLVVGALATLVADEPPMRFAVQDAERLGRALLARRRRARLGTGAGLLVAASSAAFLAVGPLGLVGADGDRPPVAIAPTTGAPDPAGGPVDPDGIQLARGFPVAMAVAAMEGALPDGVVIAGLPPDIAWSAGTAGPTLAVPITWSPEQLAGADPVVLDTTLTLGSTCTLTGAAPLLDEVQARTAADAVCAAWAGMGSPDPLAPVPRPSVPPDPAS